MREYAKTWKIARQLFKRWERIHFAFPAASLRSDYNSFNPGVQLANALKPWPKMT
jgi:hypothetical protein